MKDALFKHKKPDFDRLRAFGFAESASGFVFSTHIVDGQFNLVITISREGLTRTDLFDLASNERYVLHLVQGTQGEFVGRVREEYNAFLALLLEKCFVPDVFRSDYARQVIHYVQAAFRDEPEYLWKKFPRNAVLRRKDTGKWYAALLVLSTRKLGIDEDREVDILNVRMPSEAIESLVDRKGYFPGFHMNKKHWITICLDGAVPLEEIFGFIKTSYALAK